MHAPETGFILAAGRGFIAVNKPAGISVHNEPGRDALSLAQACLEMDDELVRACASDGTLSPAHRLDRETSGVLIFATTRPSATSLQTRIANKAQSKKLYRAIVRGVIEQKSGTWSFPISDKAEGRQNPAGKKEDRIEAITHFEVVNSNRFITEINVQIESGRQHQIRKHAALAGHPVLGDPRYNDAKHNRLIADKLKTPRMFLHAERLTLNAEGTWPELEIEAPIPAEFLSAFQ